MAKQALAALALLLSLSLGAQAFPGFGADFERTLQTAGGEEHSSGKIRIQFPGEVMIFVEEPLSQWLHYTDDYFLVHYPEQQASYKIPKKTEVSPPFISALISAVQEDFGLSKLGFTILSSSVDQDTLSVLWQAPDELKARISLVELKYLGQALVASRSYNSEQVLVAANTYARHISHHGYQVPLKTCAWQLTEAGPRTETIEYQNPEFADYSVLLDQFKALERELDQSKE